MQKETLAAGNRPVGAALGLVFQLCPAAAFNYALRLLSAMHTVPAAFSERRRNLLSDRRLDPLRPAPSPRRSAERVRADAYQLIRSDASADESEPFYGDLYDRL